MEHEPTSSLEILEEFLKIDNVEQILVIGKDGFVIESVGNDKSKNIDKLGSSLASAVNGMEEMGNELTLGSFNNMSLKYDDAFIVGAPVNDAVIAIIAPDSSSLGMMKIKLTQLIPMLMKFY